MSHRLFLQAALVPFLHAALAPFLVLALAGLVIVDAQLQYANKQSPLRFKNCKPASIKNMIVFGDSFSDTGNVFQLSKGTWPRPTYYRDGRFSNGPVWSDYVAADRQLSLTNFAFGGATTDSKVVQGYSGSGSDIPVPGFIQQIEDYYLAGGFSLDTTAMDSTLFVVNFQGNDFLFDATVGTETVLANIERGIRRLVQVGAKHMIVVQNFDIGMVPFFRWNETLSQQNSALAKKQHDEYQDLIRRLAEEYGRPLRGGNKAFYNCMDSSSMSASSRKVNITFFDLFALFKRLNSPQQLKRMGITDVIHGCVSDDAITGCLDPESHFFYDSFHPSTKVHREVADGILQLF
ncbi:GDSL lipase/esterase [Dissophora ornata]|nr:hypothetical protein BGZ58_007154 [Dissophora ornata]KAI8606463.1 GDSL lipase/esterase [Dissophora ornata]